MPWYSRGRHGSASAFLGMGFIIAKFQILGIKPNSYILLNNNVSISSDPLFLNISYGRLSRPTDLLLCV